MITTLEIDLIDACNLSCPLCNRNKHISKDGYLPLRAWEQIINGYDYLHTIYFLGTRSEHTLYPYFLELVAFIKQKNIDIVLSTNGDTHKPEWWSALAGMLREGDEVRFAIDGSTQEIYEKYRIGGNLSNVLANHKAFKEKGKKTKAQDTIQYINFDHNKDDDTEELFSSFGYARVINSSFGSGVIRPTDEYMKKYKILDTIVERIKTPQIVCETKGNQVFINYNGNVSPCCHYNEHLTLKGHRWTGEYDDIENAKYDFCTKICDKMCVKFRKDLNIEL